MTQVAAAAVLQINPTCLCRWAQKKVDLIVNPNKSKKISKHTGPTSVLADIELDLLNYIEEWRQKGFDVNRFILL